MSLVDIRLRMRIAGRNASDQIYYTNAMIDDSVDRLCARFLRVTRVVKLSETIDIDASANEADFSGLSGFLADRIERARVDEDSNYDDVGEDLDIVPVGDVLNKINDDDDTDTPCLMGFQDSSIAKFFPVPSDDGTLTVVYSPLQTPWTIGTMGAYSSSVTYQVGDVVSSSGTLYRSLIPNNVGNAVATTADWDNLGTGTLVAPASIVSVIPDGLLTELIGCGGPPVLQAVDPEHQSFTGPAWASYLEFESACRGIGSISGKTTGRETLSWR